MRAEDLTQEHNGLVVRIKWKFMYDDYRETKTGRIRMLNLVGEPNSQLWFGPKPYDWLWMCCFNLDTMEILTPEEVIIWKLENNM